MGECCRGSSLNVLSWNLCGVSWENLELLITTCGFGDWDILCFQEGLKHTQPMVVALRCGSLIVSGPGEAKGSTLIVLSPRIAPFFRGYSAGSECTGVFSGFDAKC